MTNLSMLSYLLLSLLLIQFTSAYEGPHEVHCVFIHGAGTIPEPKNSPKVHRSLKDLPEDVQTYWGNVQSWTESTGDPMHLFHLSTKEMINHLPPNDQTKFRALVDNIRPAHGTDKFPPICTSYAFTYLDTVHNRWDDEYLADAACEALYKGNDTNSFTQRIFLHSMGNLIFFNALRLGKCKINKENTNVYSFGGPFLGSDMVKTAKDLCETTKTGKAFYQAGKLVGVNNLVDSIFNVLSNPISLFFKDKIAEEIKSPAFQKKFGTICDRKTGNLTAAFASIGELVPNGNKAILALSKEYTTGAICGSEIDNADIVHKVLGKITDKIHKGNDNDGAVHIKSCQAVNPAANWNKNESSDFRVARNSHSEIIGRSLTPHICKWLATRN